MSLISPQAREIALAAVDIQYEAESRPLTTRIRTDVNDPSVQILLAEIVVRLGRIEELLAGQADRHEIHEVAFGGLD